MSSRGDACDPASGAGTKPLRTHSFGVTMGDTDAAGIIYFGAPVGWAERMITEWLAESGWPLSEQLGSGWGMPAVHLEVDYSRPLRLDDRIVGTLRSHARSAHSVTWRCQFSTEEEGPVAVEVRLTQASVRLQAGGTTLVDLPPGLAAQLDASHRHPEALSTDGPPQTQDG